jgi:16S rRNA (cytosine1402-N4)-methyltransferase
MHIPVLKETILNAFEGVTGCLLDGTFGGGGHTQMLLEQNPQLSVVGLDVDPEAAERASALKQKFGERFQFFHLNFSELEQLHQHFQAILFDLGVSSFQLDNAERGFSFRQEGPLDMRMNPQWGDSARTFLKNASRESLTQAIRIYGEEPQWRSVVNAIVRYRDNEPWDTTTEFVQFLKEHTTLLRSKKPKRHFATRVFQGIRIAVNDELSHLEKGLHAGFQALTPQGIFAVIAFHSLEDRLVKQFFYRLCGRDRSVPCPPNKIQALLLTRKPMVATEEEKIQNPRARSAKLRILKKL